MAGTSMDGSDGVAAVSLGTGRKRLWSAIAKLADAGNEGKWLLTPLFGRTGGRRISCGR